ncbi:T9SS type A sorting domain-containing protein [Psychroserpens sp. AS72]|uniref:T9SS type A sorting domain-containing protein n=1 Tax=Psychroserpens sp. AS72 TaxID=3135775 RepID=UPI003171C7AB
MATGDHYLHLRVQDQDGTWSLYKRALINVDPLSVGEFNSESFDIFPNPTKDNIHINFKQFGDYSFSIYDVFGKEIFQQKKLEVYNIFDL